MSIFNENLAEDIRSMVKHFFYFYGFYKKIRNKLFDYHRTLWLNFYLNG